MIENLNLPTDVCQKSSMSSSTISTGWSFSPTILGFATFAVAVAKMDLDQK